MYIDHQRSWFLHNNVHSNRMEGGIEVGSTVGVLLDLDHHQLSFYVDGEPQVMTSRHNTSPFCLLMRILIFQGSVAFTDLCGVFYPAVSLNRNVQVQLQSALSPPTGSPRSSGQDSGEESDECHNNGTDVSDRNTSASAVASITCAVAAL